MTVRICFAMVLLAGALGLKESRGQSPMPHGPVRISGGVIAGNLISRVQPVYPEDVRPSGVVVLHVIVGKDGHPENIQVISGPEILRQPTIEAVRQWVYRPYLLNGEPTEVDTTVQVSVQMGVRTPPVPQSENGLVRIPALDVSPGVMERQLVSKWPVDYPPIAKAAHVSGTVVLNVYIGKNGLVGSMTAASGPPMLIGAAMESVKHWVYRPYVLNGEPILVKTTVEVGF